MSHDKSCPICLEGDIVQKLTLFDDRYGYPGEFSLLKCRSCGHHFVGNVAFSDDQISHLYSDYYPRGSIKADEYRPAVERRGFSAWLDGAKASAFRWVPREVRVLDIGSGLGQSLGYHAARGCEVWGVESDPNVLGVAERQGFNVKIGVFDPHDFPADYFDVVTLDQVIEHMRDPLETMIGVRTLLRRGGVAILSTPNAYGWGAKVFGRRWINWHAPYHLHFFSTRSMRIAAHRAGLEFRSLGTITPSEWLRYQSIHQVTKRRQAQTSPFWSGQGSFRLAERVAIKLASYLHVIRVNHLITRTFDKVGLGDSQLFELTKV